MPISFVDSIQRYLAISAITPSSLRRQGAPGVVRVAQAYLQTLSLKPFVNSTPPRFARALDQRTRELQNLFPVAGRSWGAARKAINLFLRDATYNCFLREEYGLEQIEPFLELPLDKYVADGLRRRSKGIALPRWLGVKRLSMPDSACFQARAAAIANNVGLARIHLDLELWVAGRTSSAG